MELTPELLIQLAAIGAKVETRPDGTFTVTGVAKMTSAEKRSERNRRQYERLKSSESVLKTTESSDKTEYPLPLSPSLPLSPQTPLSPAHPHAPTPAPPAHVREENDFNLTNELKLQPKIKPQASNESWIQGLENDPIYQWIDIRYELGKMQRWCSENRKDPSRRRFINWLNKIPRPIATLSNRTLTAEQIEVGSWVNRRSDAIWTLEEFALWDRIPQPFHPEDWQAIRWFYTTAPGNKKLLQSLPRLLNNWNGEIDRAKTYDPNAK